MNAPIWQIKKEMCDIGNRIWQRGYCAGNEGNHSVRISEDRVVCTPTGISKGFLDPEDLCIVDMDGNQVESNGKGRKRTSEVLVHLAIYKKQPTVKAVIHSHPPHAVAFCLANIPLPEGIHPEAEVFLGRTIFAKYATPGGPDLPASFIDRINEQTNTILMANHGSVSLGSTLIEAYYRLEILDNYCKQLILTKQLGQVNVLDDNQMTDLLKVKQRFGFPDDRLKCAPTGCVGPDNEAFLTTFGVQPMSASCGCDGQVATPSAAAGGSDADFEQLVRSITDQIMAGAK
ncbi:class II aldolase/adducin family protein [Mucisphaera calidilacus]|uniref:Methylthioribulose-1-phosphate dehydratase n=1 Tax=Mucisphaera calidilacus TaxID=2527982 RepID=A0A518BYG9_9BACT|nr:class II aldolase/adducin family protein [Mucisphaera calidilacus]QDU72008.1 Methylthioribulose-1-phosphate dehydratase [Mucisphaera calidilacus]